MWVASLNYACWRLASVLRTVKREVREKMTKGVLIKTDGKWWSYDKDRGVYRNVQNPDDKIHQLELALKLSQRVSGWVERFFIPLFLFF